MALGRTKKSFHTRERSKRIFLRRIVLSISFIIASAGLLAMVWYGTRLEPLTITQVQVTGVETVSADSISDKVNAMLAGSYLGLVPYRFTFLFPKQRIHDAVVQISRIATADIVRNGRTLTVRVTEHVPRMMWCGEATTSDCYFVDERGIAYEKAPDLTGSTLMRFMVASTSPQVGDALLDDTIRTTLFDIARTIETQHGFRISRIDRTGDDATFELSGGGTILISTLNDPQTTYANLASILTSKKFEHLAPGNFEYIDLRFGNKIFVEETKATTTTSVSTSTPVQ